MSKDDQCYLLTLSHIDQLTRACLYQFPIFIVVLWALQAYYLSFFELLDNRSVVGQQHRQIFGRLANEPNEEIRKSVAHYLTPVIEKYFWLFQQIVPHLSPDEFAWRFRAMHGIVATHFVETLIPGL